MVELGSGGSLAESQLGCEVLGHRSPRREALLEQRHVVAATSLSVIRSRLASTVGDPFDLGDRMDAAVEDLEPVGADAHVHELADMLLGDRVRVRLVEDVRRRVDVALHDVARVVGHPRQRLQVRPFLVEHLRERSPGHRVWPLHRVRVTPPRETLAKRLSAPKCPAVAEIVVDVPKRSFDFSFVLWVAARRDMHREAVVGGEVDEADVQDRLVAFPAVDDTRHRVRHALPWHTLELGKALVEPPQDRRLSLVVVGSERSST